MCPESRAKGGSLLLSAGLTIVPACCFYPHFVLCKLPCVLQGPAGLSAGDDAATTSWQPGALQTKHIQVGSRGSLECGELRRFGAEPSEVFPCLLLSCFSLGRLLSV